MYNEFSTCISAPNLHITFLLASRSRSLHNSHHGQTTRLHVPFHLPRPLANNYCRNCQRSHRRRKGCSVRHTGLVERRTDLTVRRTDCTRPQGQRTLQSLLVLLGTRRPCLVAGSRLHRNLAQSRQASAAQQSCCMLLRHPCRPVGCNSMYYHCILLGYCSRLG